MEYVVDGTHYIMSYRKLREEYHRHLEMTDKEFLKNLPSAAHLACIICFLKETPSYLVLSDKGIIHELIHLIHHGEQPLINLKDIRKLFKETLKLS